MNGEYIIFLFTGIFLILFFLLKSFRSPHLHFLPLIGAIFFLIFSFEGNKIFIDLFNWIDQQLQLHFGYVLPNVFYDYLNWSINILLLIILILLRWIFIILERIVLKFINLQFPFPAYYRLGFDYFLYKKYNGLHRFLFWSSLIFTAFIFWGLHLTYNKMASIFSIIVWAPVLAVIYEAAIYFSGKIRWIDLRFSLQFETPSWKWINMFNKTYLMYEKYFSKYILFKGIYQKNLPSHPNSINEIEIISKFQRQDILITDPFNDTTQSVIINIISHYFQFGKKIIVLTHNILHLQEFFNSVVPPLKEQLYIFSNNIYFTQSIIDPQIKYYPIYFITFDDLETWYDIDLWDEIVLNVGTIIVLHPTEMYPELHARIAQLFQKVNLPEWIRMLIIAEKWHNVEESIRLIYKRKNILEIQTLPSNNFKRYIIVWEGKGNYFYDFFPAINYVPPPTILSLVPLYFGIKPINWLDAGDFERDSVETLAGQIGIHHAKISELNEINLNVEDLRLQTSWRIWESESIRFSFIFDRFYNLPFLLNYLEKHGSLQIEFVNILSEYYLLRPYFLKYFKYFLKKPFQEILLPITTWPATSVKQVLVSLLRTLSHKSLTEKEIQSLFFYDLPFWEKVYIFIKPSSKEIFKLTANSLNNIIYYFFNNIFPVNLIQETYLWNEQEQAYIKHFHLVQPMEILLNIKDEFTFHLLGQTETLYYRSIVNLDNIIYHVYLRKIVILHLPHQKRTDVKSYQIESIDVQNKKIFVQHQTPRFPRNLIPSICINIHNAYPFKTISFNQKELKVNYAQYFLNFKREIKKIIELQANDSSTSIHYGTLEPESVFPEELLKKDFLFARGLQIHINFQHMDKSLLQDNIPQIAFTLSYVLQHVLQSFFPTAYKQIKVYSPQAKSLFTTPELNNSMTLQLAFFLYPDVRFPEALPLNSTVSNIEIWIIEESENGLGVCEYLYNTELLHIWDIVEDYLHFTLENPEANRDSFIPINHFDKNNFLFEINGALKIVSVLNQRTQISLKDRRTKWNLNPDDNFVEIIPPALRPAGVECDFCGIKIGEKAYTILEDGRTLCEDCQKTAVTSEEKFKEILRKVYTDIEEHFQIQLPKVSNIFVINTADLQRRLGETFVPTPQYDPRTVGVAIQNNQTFEIYIENGAPYWNTYLTLAHELTHIWQYVVLKNLDSIPLELLEGHTTYVEYALAQWYLKKNDDIILKRILKHFEQRAKTAMDVYGVGLQYFLQHVNGVNNPFWYMMEIFGRQEY